MKNSNVKKKILRISLAALMIVSLSVLASCYSGAEFPGGNEEGSHSVYRGTEPFAVVSMPYPYQELFYKWRFNSQL